jgi:hypothetical protein
MANAIASLFLDGGFLSGQFPLVEQGGMNRTITVAVSALMPLGPVRSMRSVFQVKLQCDE